jgi:hypothetical protein
MNFSIAITHVDERERGAVITEVRSSFADETGYPFGKGLTDQYRPLFLLLSPSGNHAFIKSVRK